jgi:alpha-galactosidase
MTSNRVYQSITLREGPQPGVRYTSGFTMYDEALVDGHWIGRYWAANGRVKPEIQLARDLPELLNDPLDAFEIALDGQDLAGGWTWVGASELQGGGPAPFASQSGGRHHVVELAHTTRPIGLKVHTWLDGTPFLVRWLELTNRSDGPTALSALSCWSGLIWSIRNYPMYVPAEPGSVFRVGSYTSSLWGYEGDFAWEDLPPGEKRIEGRMGRSGWGRPCVIASNEAQGEWFMAELAWSGNWAIHLRCRQDLHFRADQRFGGLPDARLRISVGPVTADPALRVIAPGETVTLPPVHLGHLHGDLDTLVQATHTHVRNSVLPAQVPGRAQLVQCNPNVYLVCEMTEESLRQQIDLAAAVGVELFYVDAGWYGREPNVWPDNVGDWTTGPWLPNGLEPVRAYAREKGLLFGLWLEPESIGAHSALREAHPDWVLTRDGKPAGSRDERVGRALDLTKSEVATWVEAEIGRIIERYDLDLFRLDYNTVVYEGGNRVVDGFVENTLWRHYDVLYGILDRLKTRFPNVIFENCAGGGGRTDLGMMTRFHTTWISDWALAPRSVQILNGMTLTLPPEVCNRVFGPVGLEFSRGDLDFQARLPLFGHALFKAAAPTLDELNPLTRERVAHHIRLYQEFIRPFLSTARVFHHTPVLPMTGYNPWCVLEYASPDADRAYIGFFRLNPVGNDEYCCLPKGLDRSRRYRVTFDNQGVSVERTGDELMARGICVLLERALTSELILLEALDR